MLKARTVVITSGTYMLKPALIGDNSSYFVPKLESSCYISVYSDDNERCFVCKTADS